MDQRVAELTVEQASAVRALCRDHCVRRLAFFGSAVSGKFDLDRSDYDIVVSFDRDPGQSMADQYFGLKQSLEDLLQRKVDLVVDGAVRNRFFRAELDATAVELYAA